MNQFDVREFGTAADGVTNDGPRIQSAIDNCSAVGGGRVTVPAGDYLCGTIRLKTGVELHLEAGAVLRCSLNREHIVQTEAPDGAEEECGYFLGAAHCHDIAVTGRGVIDGQGSRIMADDGADGGFHECPVLTNGFRPRLTFFEDVEDMRIEGVTFRDSSHWTLHMAGCRRVRVTGINILNNNRGANNDGIDPDSCQDVLISDCIIRTGDDAIVVKTTEPMTRLYGPCQNIIIRGCILHSHDSALKVGTETHGDIRNILMSDCIIEDCSRAIGIWVRDGACLENIRVHDLTGAVRRYADAPGRAFAPGWWGKGEPVFISNTWRNAAHKESGKRTGVIREVSFENISLKAESCIFLGADEDCPVEQIRLKNIHISMEKQGTQPGGLFDEQPSMRNLYEHGIPGLYARRISGLQVSDLEVQWRGEIQPWWTHLAELEGCGDARLENIRGKAAREGIESIVDK